MKFEISKFVAGNSAQINTISLAELIKDTKASGLMPYETQFGTKVFLTKNGERVQVNGKNMSGISIGSKAVLPAADLFSEKKEERAAALKELVNNNLIYWGENTIEENGQTVTRPWITFSRKGTFVPGKETSFADILEVTGLTKEQLLATA